MRLRPVAPALDPPGLRFTFAIAAGVRRADTALRDQIDGALARRRVDIERVLRQYGVPLVGSDGGPVAAGDVSLRGPASCAPGVSREDPCSR
jgi:mxaJ protein